MYLFDELKKGKKITEKKPRTNTTRRKKCKKSQLS